jgi:hypothetical protein
VIGAASSVTPAPSRTTAAKSVHLIVLSMFMFFGFQSQYCQSVCSSSNFQVLDSDATLVGRAVLLHAFSGDARLARECEPYLEPAAQWRSGPRMVTLLVNNARCGTPCLAYRAALHEQCIMTDNRDVLKENGRDKMNSSRAFR